MVFFFCVRYENRWCFGYLVSDIDKFRDCGVYWVLRLGVFDIIGFR